MQTPGVGVAAADDVVSGVSADFLGAGGVASPDTFDLQAQEEVLHDGIIPSVDLAAHAGTNAVRLPGNRSGPVIGIRMQQLS